MQDALELLPDQPDLIQPLFADAAEYDRFRERFIETVTPQLERWREDRRKCEEESRQRPIR